MGKNRAQCLLSHSLGGLASWLELEIRNRLSIRVSEDAWPNLVCAVELSFLLVFSFLHKTGHVEELAHLDMDDKEHRRPRRKGR